jgi:hypothetical protein
MCYIIIIYLFFFFFFGGPNKIICPGRQIFKYRPDCNYSYYFKTLPEIFFLRTPLHLNVNQRPKLNRTDGFILILDRTEPDQ